MKSIIDEYRYQSIPIDIYQLIDIGNRWIIDGFFYCDFHRLIIDLLLIFIDEKILR
jgi:hypothetical protein